MLRRDAITKAWWRILKHTNLQTKRGRRTCERESIRPALEPLEDRRLLTTIIGLTTNNGLVRFDSASPGAVTTIGTISNIVSGDKMAAIDFQPGSGPLYGLGVNGKFAHFYAIDTTTAT